MYDRSSIFIPSSEPGVRLQVVVASPRSSGPFPTLIFNHGSTGEGRNTSLYKKVMCPSIIEHFFTQRGWLVLFPQRRGRGRSEGRYGEGLASNGSGYSCVPEVALQGLDRAIEDLDSVIAFIQTRNEVEMSRVAIGGVSRGGILSIAYAGSSPIKLCGAINFSGGWLGKACPTYEQVNPFIFRKGAKSDIETLWLHGSKDSYYGINHCRRNFESFILAGGKGTFISARAGHGLLFKPQLWAPTLDNYIAKMPYRTLS